MTGIHQIGCFNNKENTTSNISIISLNSLTPVLMASAAASVVPTMTGVPEAKPVSRAACSVTRPAISQLQKALGSRSIGVM